MKGVKDRRLFFAKNSQTPGSFLGKNGQKSGSKFNRMAPKNLIGENGGERKKNPSANSVHVIKKKYYFLLSYFRLKIKPPVHV